MLALPLVVVNPNPDVLWPDATNATNPSMNTNLDKVRLQYRPVTGGEWITAKSEDGRFKDDNYKFNFLCEDSRTVGCKFDWNLNNAYDKLLSGFKDGAYELRLKSFCINAPTLADISVQEYVSDTTLALFVDTKAPMERENCFGRGHSSASLSRKKSTAARKRCASQRSIRCATAHKLPRRTTLFRQKKCSPRTR